MYSRYNTHLRQTNLPAGIISTTPDVFLIVSQKIAEGAPVHQVGVCVNTQENKRTININVGFVHFVNCSNITKEVTDQAAAPLSFESSSIPAVLWKPWVHICQNDKRLRSYKRETFPSHPPAGSR